MNGCLRVRSYVNVYPISDSSEAAGHLMLSVETPTVPTRRFKSSATSSRVSSHSRHILIFKATRRDSTCQERYHKKKTKKKNMMEHRFGARARQANRDASWLLWLGGLDDGAHIKGYAVVQGTAACVQLGIDCSGNWWSSGTIRLRGSAVRWESTLPASLLIDGKIISAAY